MGAVYRLRRKSPKSSEFWKRLISLSIADSCGDTDALNREWSIRDIAVRPIGLASELGPDRGGQGANKGAIEQWTKAVAIQDRLNYDQPADRYCPVRKSLGAALLGAGKVCEAEAVFRVDLQKNPRPLFVLMQALRAQAREADAAWVETRFHAAWKNASANLTLSTMQDITAS